MRMMRVARRGTVTMYSSKPSLTLSSESGWRRYGDNLDGEMDGMKYTLSEELTLLGHKRWG